MDADENQSDSGISVIETTHAPDADPRTVPHEDVRAWLLRLAGGEFDLPPPG